MRLSLLFAIVLVDLIGFARELGADCLATGHYVRRLEQGGRGQMWKGADPRRSGDLAGEICAFLKAGVDGLFSDNPGPAIRARDDCGR